MTLIIDDDSIKLEAEEGRLEFVAVGGPEENIEVWLTVKGKNTTFEITSDQRDTLQTALLNFGNTGYFNREM